MPAVRTAASPVLFVDVAEEPCMTFPPMTDIVCTVILVGAMWTWWVHFAHPSSSGTAVAIRANEYDGFGCAFYWKDVMVLLILVLL